MPKLKAVSGWSIVLTSICTGKMMRDITRMPKTTQTIKLGLLYLMIKAFKMMPPMTEPMKDVIMNSQACRMWMAPAIVNCEVVEELVKRTTKPERAVEV